MPLVKVVGDGKFEEINDWAEEVVVDEGADSRSIRQNLKKLFSRCKLSYTGEGEIYAVQTASGDIYLQGVGGASIGEVSRLPMMRSEFECVNPGSRTDISCGRTRYTILHGSVDVPGKMRKL